MLYYVANRISVIKVGYYIQEIEKFKSSIREDVKNELRS